MSLVPKTKKEEGKKHKTKKKIQKKQQIFKIKLRKDRFWMFGPHSKPISAILAWFKADSGCFGQFQLPANTIRFGQTGPVRRESVKKKKKKSDVALTRGSDADAVPILPCPCIIVYDIIMTIYLYPTFFVSSKLFLDML